MLVMWPPECSSELFCLLSLFVCLLALSHLLEIVCLSKGKGEGGKEAEWELSAVTASLVHVLYFLKMSLKLVEMSTEAHALLSPPARSPIALGIFLAM